MQINHLNFFREDMEGLPHPALLEVLHKILAMVLSSILTKSEWEEEMQDISTVDMRTWEWMVKVIVMEEEVTETGNPQEEVIKTLTMISTIQLAIPMERVRTDLVEEANSELANSKIMDIKEHLIPS